MTGVTEVSPGEPLLPAEVPPDPPQNQGRCPERNPENVRTAREIKDSLITN